MPTSSDFLFQAAEVAGLEPRWETEYGVFSIDVHGSRVMLFQSYTPLNSQLSGYYSRNKHLTKLFIQKLGLPTIPYSLPQTHEELMIFFSTHAPVIAKPLESFRGKGVEYIDSETKLKTVEFAHRMFEKYIEGDEYRYLVLNQEVIAVQKRELITPRMNFGQKKRTTIEKDQWQAQLVHQAVSLAKVMELSFCAVDFIVTSRNEYILEVNSAPGLRPFHQPDNGSPVLVAPLLLQALLATYKVASI